jgi:DNA-3-methyladenine glycosylase II
MQSAAERHLKRRDPVLRSVITQVGPCGYSLQRDRFGMLVRSIVFQQISGAAARTILGRLVDALPGNQLAPEGLAGLTLEQYRLAGVSKQKAGYLQSLAELSLSGDLALQRIGRLSDEKIIAQLTQVKGIGVWTAQMFLMFSLGRPDVLPWDDLGVRQAIRKLYGLSEMPTRGESERIAAPWRPYASVASWYCWRSLEIKTPESSEEWQS